jgi:hypothetical protein
MKLTDTQLVILSKASQRDDRIAELPATKVAPSTGGRQALDGGRNCTCSGRYCKQPHAPERQTACYS